MTSSQFRLSRRLLTGLVTLAAAFPMAQAANAQTPAPAPASPLTLLPPVGNVPFLASHGDGVQIYRCNGSAWTFVAPRANLTDVFGRVIISHFGGPTWQANDGSKVVGTLSSSVSVNPNAIPWLLLSGAPSGKGLLGHTSYIQRLLTHGGLAPAASTCTTKAAGTQVEVPYTAEYVFWKSLRL